MIRFRWAAAAEKETTMPTEKTAVNPADFASHCPMAPTEAAPMNGEPVVLGEGSDILFLQTRTQHSGLDEATKLGLEQNGCNK